ncbi:LTA synthase family protein [Bombilactobacillus folatiphilus]|uniref:LTA synthase family protein n=1 Tax=Bombilactobacillus folatiphilus TaxID=2923362 RepID=A0ABY4P7Z5_9LACO|nr:LTA synthase family protein [Bombilactobacillus folatiphilus]UQS81646.1 LTA synthase family protein [Bombilactobacillus folatiphilus]
MKNLFKRIHQSVNTKLGFFMLTVILCWIKTYLICLTKFNLGIKSVMQAFLLFLNPIPTTILLLGISLYMKGRKSYIYMMIIDAITSTWLFANILYYREFSDFLTLTLIKGSSSASNNLGTSILGIILPTDFLAFSDVAILIILLIIKFIKLDKTKLNFKIPLTITGIAVVSFGINLTLAQQDRSGLLTRTFDNNYIVKYLGLNAYSVYDTIKAAKTSAVKANADSSDMKTVKKYINNNYVAPNVQYTGVAKGKNVFVIHLESFQQFLIDFKWDGQEVTPNLNKIYHEQNTLSFDNFFNQVGQGKTADAEMMMENSLFGLPEGAAMVTDGTSNTFQAAPAILDQHGYTTASFHGDVPSFWNRDNTYKSWGYDYFFSSNYYKQKKSYNIGYGMKDKIFMKDTANYIQKLPQPFYSKIITVTNHYPYLLDKKNQSIAKTDTGDSTVDGYVQTAHYLDQSVGEFMNWLKATGLDKNSMVVFYGDHYGISGNHKKAVAKLLGKKKFNDFDNAQFQRVPFMIHMKGIQGGINHTYGGEIDALPTILNLLGVNNKDNIQFGSDLLAPNHPQLVAFRDGDFVSPEFTKVNGAYYYTKNGTPAKNLSKDQHSRLETMSNQVATELSLSDKIITGDLLRFYNPKGFQKVNKKDYNYSKSKSLQKLKDQDKKDQTSLEFKNNNKSLLNLYDTDAPELQN